MASREKIKIFTVSQVNSLVKVALANNLPGSFIVTGEITGWKRHHSGHCYFSLKDEESQLPSVMWSSSFKKAKFQPENGLAVLATGHVDVYLPQGKYQFYVETLKPAGVGALQLAFEQMVKKLQAEGLFEERYKKPIPSYPERIGILTSASGAAVADIQNSIHQRWPCTRLFLYPVLVQGEGAAEKIASAIKDVNRRNAKLKLDLLIVGRGGGSPEDLWAFNEEAVARAIFTSKIPIISAVGHEIDTTIADLVADARASTPTKAGVVAVPDMVEVLQHVEDLQRRLRINVQSTLSLGEQHLRTILASSVFKNPKLSVLNASQRLDEVSIRLAEVIRDILSEVRAELHRSYERIVKIEPHRLLGRKTVSLNDLQNRLLTTVRSVISKNRIELTAQANRLAGLNPKTALLRGYSITTSKTSGKLIRKVDDVSLGDTILTELAQENLIESKVTKK